MALKFGTDGIREIAGTALTSDFAMKLGQAAGLTATNLGVREDKPIALIGKDTRVSCDMLESAVAAGLCSMGVDVVFLGVIATPAVAYLMSKYNADLGVVISASHNPYEHNGIKFFGKGGMKLSDEQQAEIEKLLAKGDYESFYKENRQIGRTYYSTSAADDYVKYLVDFAGDYFIDMRVVFDAANGAATTTIEAVAKKLMLNYKIINNEPDGTNINKNCGSLNMSELTQAVIDHKAILGIAFDGDADRLLAVDEKGGVHDGDELCALFATYMMSRGELNNNTLVTTTMSNLGLTKFCKEQGIELIQTDVGDRYVLNELDDGGYSLGGEQSGHIILRDIASTGDGQLAAVYLMKILQEKKVFLSRSIEGFRKYPQVMINVKVTDDIKAKFEKDDSYMIKLDEISSRLADDGRIIVRASGTEPLIRIMVEGKELNFINDIALEMSEIIKKIR